MDVGVFHVSSVRICTFIVDMSAYVAGAYTHLHTCAHVSTHICAYMFPGTFACTYICIYANTSLHVCR